MPPELPSRYRAERWYSAPRLGRKGSRYALVAGRKTVVTAITLYHCLRDSDTPAWAKGVIVGALGYLILPVDMVPDLSRLWRRLGGAGDRPWYRGSLREGRAQAARLRAGREDFRTEGTLSLS